MGYCQLKTVCVGSWQRPSGLLSAENCLCRKLTDPVGYCQLCHLGWMTTQPECWFLQSLSAVNWFSGGLSFKMILTATAKECWREAGSPEEVLGWAFMVIVVQLASLICKKRGEVAWWNTDKAGWRLKGRNWPFTSPTLWLSLVSLMKSEMGIHSNGSVDFHCLRWWTRAVDFCRLEWCKG